MIEISNGRIFIDGVETINPELIGYAMIDAVEAGTIQIINTSEPHCKRCKCTSHDRISEN